MVWECPVLVFDAVSIATGKPDGDYYAGEGGVDQSMLHELGFATTSFFFAQHPEKTMMIFGDQYTSMDYSEDLTKHGWEPRRMQTKPPLHPQTHWYVVLAR